MNSIYTSAAEVNSFLYLINLFILKTISLVISFINQKHLSFLNLLINSSILE